MFSDYLIFIVLLVVIAALTQVDFAFSVLYLLSGAYIIGRVWSEQAMKRITFERQFTPRAYINEEVSVNLKLKNTGLLPVVWLRIHESLPVSLIVPAFVNQVCSLGPNGEFELNYLLRTSKRGYYPIGPLRLSSGDLLGMVNQQYAELASERLTVFPKIVPLKHLKLPASSPMGTLRHNQPIFEDTTRVLNKRNYVAGDSLRRVDWKATATTGQLQVKQYEPSIALEVAIFLNLRAEDYEHHSRIDASELAIVIAASTANWLTGQKQTVGLVTNGTDPHTLEQDHHPEEVPAIGGRLRNASANRKPPRDAPTTIALGPRRGRSQLMHILETLARVQAGKALPFTEMIQQQAPHLGWGTTLVLITPQAGDPLFEQIFQVRRSGLNVVLVVPGRVAFTRDARQHAAQFNVPIYFIKDEADLDTWRL